MLSDVSPHYHRGSCCLYVELNHAAKGTQSRAILLDHSGSTFHISAAKEIKCRCLRPSFCTMKAELGRGELGLMRCNFYEVAPRAVSNTRPSARYHETTTAPYINSIDHNSSKNNKRKPFLYFQ